MHITFKNFSERVFLFTRFFGGVLRSNCFRSEKGKEESQTADTATRKAHQTFSNSTQNFLKTFLCLTVAFLSTSRGTLLLLTGPLTGPSMATHRGVLWYLTGGFLGTSRGALCYLRGPSLAPQPLPLLYLTRPSLLPQGVPFCTSGRASKGTSRGPTLVPQVAPLGETHGAFFGTSRVLLWQAP